MPHCSDATGWDHKLTALERMMAQVVVAITKNNPFQVVEITQTQEEGLIVMQPTPTTMPHDLNPIFNHQQLTLRWSPNPQLIR
jgi:hypothetical protein